MGTGREAVAVAADYRPEVILLDIGLPDVHGTEVAQRLRRELGHSLRDAAGS